MKKKLIFALLVPLSTVLVACSSATYLSENEPKLNIDNQKDFDKGDNDDSSLDNDLINKIKQDDEKTNKSETSDSDSDDEAKGPFHYLEEPDKNLNNPYNSNLEPENSQINSNKFDLENNLENLNDDSNDSVLIRLFKKLKKADQGNDSQIVRSNLNPDSNFNKYKQNKLENTLNESEKFDKLDPKKDFDKINERSLNDFKPNLLSDAEATTQNVHFSSWYRKFTLDNSSGVIKSENDSMFLGAQNNNLNIYLLDKINKSLGNNGVSAIKNSYLNPDSWRSILDLKYVGFKSEPYEDKQYENIYQRNVRFPTGTGILLDSSDREALFLTNFHVLNLGAHFWNSMNTITTSPDGKLYYINKSLGTFLRWYDNGKINTLNNITLIKLWQQKYAYDKKKNNPSIENVSIAEITKYLQNLYDRYFEVAGFNTHGQDVAAFYFKYSNFISDVKQLLNFYDETKTHWHFTLESQRVEWEKSMTELNEQFKAFESFWKKISKFKPLKFSNRQWRPDDIDYTAKIGLFYPGDANAKNFFKGVQFKYDSKNVPRPFFLATNGPGASGSGVYNLDGSLAFINSDIILDNDKDVTNQLYYDQNNMSSYLSRGVAFVTSQYNLIPDIEALYLRDADGKLKRQTIEDSKPKIYDDGKMHSEYIDFE